MGASRKESRFGEGEESGVQVAALPFRETEHGLEVMLITSRDSGRWVLPKGWPESGETFCAAALREAGEEAGLRGSISKRETGVYHYGKALKSGEERRCEVLVFPLKVERVARGWPEKGQRIRKWFSPRDAASQVHEPELADLLSGFGEPGSAAE